MYSVQREFLVKVLEIKSISNKEKGTKNEEKKA